MPVASTTRSTHTVMDSPSSVWSTVTASLPSGQFFTDGHLALGEEVQRVVLHLRGRTRSYWPGVRMSL